MICTAYLETNMKNTIMNHKRDIPIVSYIVVNPTKNHPRKKHKLNGCDSNHSEVVGLWHWLYP